MRCRISSRRCHASHDERCSNGSGRGSAPPATCKGRRGAGSSAGASRRPEPSSDASFGFVRPLTRESSASERNGADDEASVSSNAARRRCPRSVRKGRGHVSAMRRASGRSQAVRNQMGLRARLQGAAGERGERTRKRARAQPSAPETGLRRSRGRARGSYLVADVDERRLVLGRKTAGLAHRRPRFGGVSYGGEGSAGSRVAVAKATSTRAANPVAGSS